MTIGTKIILPITEAIAQTQMTIEAQIMTAIGAEIIIRDNNPGQGHNNHFQRGGGHPS